MGAILLAGLGFTPERGGVGLEVKRSVWEPTALPSVPLVFAAALVASVLALVASS